MKVWKAHNELRLLAEENGFSTKNVLGEFTEMLCADVLNLELTENNQEGFDAYDTSRARIQIKGRQIKSGNSAKLTTLWNLDFDFIIAVIFDATGNVFFAQKIPVSAVIKKTKIDPKKNCRRYIANIKDVGSYGIEDLTEKLNYFLDNL